LVVGWLLAFVFRLNPQQKYVSVLVTLLPISLLNTSSRKFAMAAAMIMNSNSLPVALLQSLAVSVPGLEWGQDDTIDSIVGRALTYILLSGTMGQFVSFI
jgi:auxin efflux carrier family protein